MNGERERERMRHEDDDDDDDKLIFKALQKLKSHPYNDTGFFNVIASLARRYIGTISIPNLSIDTKKKNRKELDNIHYKV